MGNLAMIDMIIFLPVYAIDYHVNGLFFWECIQAIRLLVLIDIDRYSLAIK